MGARDPRFDGYIAKSAEFARPILNYLRDTVHEACPDVVETMKWSSPSYTYRGMLCGMAAFKQHCAFGFWRGAQVVPASGAESESAGHFGRITAVSDLPSKKKLVGYIKKAMQLNEAGVPARQAPKPKKPLPLPDDLKKALARNKGARATYESFSPSHQREYIEWITEAKGEATRTRRVTQAIEWMAEGKSRNWKYVR